MGNITSFLGNVSIDTPQLTMPIIVLLVWTLFWKGWALWLAARRDEKPWFLLVLFLNTAGILEIIYIFAIAKRSDIKVIRESQNKEETGAGE